ncbi:hypothetical protein [uncultured Mediterranean phage uvDeep-CGR0-AD1-C123]|nr:hypothetical protein [uncultured Mediterranean phage uvDeep-CGR0-AD1-C123]
MVELTPMDMKNLTIQQLEELINIRHSDISVYIGQRGRVCLTGDVSYACLNGLSVQINLEQAELDDVMEDSSFQHAFKSFNLSDEDVETVLTALKQKADFHTQSRKDNVDAAVVDWVNSVILRIEDQHALNAGEQLKQ